MNWEGPGYLEGSRTQNVAQQCQICMLLRQRELERIQGFPGVRAQGSVRAKLYSMSDLKNVANECQTCSTIFKLLKQSDGSGRK